MKQRYYVLIGFFIAVVQTYLGQLFEINGVVPDLVLVYIVCLALQQGNKPALITGLVVGLMYDILFADYIGLYSIFYVTVGYVIGYFRHNFFYSNVQIALVFTIVSTTLKYLFIKIFQIFISVNFNMINIKVIFFTILYNVLICILIHFVLTKVKMWSEDERK
ncbi:rod shape-determining protein MreD [Clostridium sp. 'deep sea']|uniref:rod shape-determining protein MreD n=1 Tax=Clostridium sp. 'deep sea' TaxID=2779445 RepID=UPI0018965E56|nr:rod shape-determining protein MreD [Clostridium sp. 'deep sea']QOR36340.1 rod shape-determining protein MreD [Clostridium sp. 'deep sea']